jgi:hypothetical protein
MWSFGSVGLQSRDTDDIVILCRSAGEAEHALDAIVAACFSRSFASCGYGANEKRGLKHRATFKSSWYLFASFQLQSAIKQ